VLDEYCRLYPEVQPDVQLDDRVGNWVEDRVDVGFCLGNPPEEGLIAPRTRRRVIGQLAVPTAASLIRSGRLVPLLLEHMADDLRLFVYYGSRAAQPARVRRFIDLVVERLTDSSDFVLRNEELAMAGTKHLRPPLASSPPED
jgi:DNA-binding transcriptional LysR family regulator